MHTMRPMKNRRASDGKQLASEICATPADKAIHFYIEHFVIGLPDEPKVSHELRDSKWVHSRETRDIMAAIGLAGLANLTGDKEMNTLSKHHYGLALSHMAGAIRNPGSFDVELILRATVMMAMYEVTRGRDEPVSPARTHIMGGAAILTSILPLRQGPTDGPRGLLQLCFSMLASIQGSFQYSSPEPNILIPAIPEPQCADALPETFSSWLSVSDKTVSTQDAPSADLIKIIARFVQLSSLVRSQPLLDNTPQPASIIREALAIDKALDDWQALQTGDWAITEERFNNTTPLPPDDAVFEASYHVYSNMYIARVWNHYRWARTLVNQLLLESLTKFPLTTRILLPQPTFLSLPSSPTSPAQP
ncbi:hypothetical protein N0V88_001791 [Collariella sp. IMI 366227]|nr:hypothetical protein N0V88_001791 [Collariella sp. IMI 366227]